MKRTLLIVLLVLMALPTATARIGGGGPEDCEDPRILPTVTCLAGGANGTGLVNNVWRKYTPLEEGPHCLPFEGYNSCS